MSSQDVESPPLHIAAYLGTFDPEQALQASSENGNKTTVRLLLENGADVDQQGRDSISAVQAASVQGHKSILRLLLRA